MKPTSVRFWSALVVAGAVVSPSWAGQTSGVRANTVIPVVLEDDLSIQHNRKGDRFAARVDDSRDLPRGSRLEGVVTAVREARNGRSAFLDAVFDSVILPDGRRFSVQAVPVSLNAKGIGRDRDGRLTADTRRVRSEGYVAGGLLGGLIVGGLLRKPFEGAFLGTLAGILIGESEKNAAKGQYVIHRGQRLGALFQRDLRFDGYSDRWQDSNSDRRGRNVRSRDDGYDRMDRDAPRDTRGSEVRSGRYESDPLPDSSRGDRYESADNTRETLDLQVDGRPVTFADNERPYLDGSTWMVPIERGCLAFGLQSEQYDSGRLVLIEGDDTMLRLEQDSDFYRLNGKKGRLDKPVSMRDGVMYAPISILASATPKTVSVNGRKLAKSAY